MLNLRGHPDNDLDGVTIDTFALVSSAYIEKVIQMSPKLDEQLSPPSCIATDPQSRKKQISIDYFDDSSRLSKIHELTRNVNCFNHWPSISQGYGDE